MLRTVVSPDVFELAWTLRDAEQRLALAERMLAERRLVEALARRLPAQAALIRAEARALLGADHPACETV